MPTGHGAVDGPYAEVQGNFGRWGTAPKKDSVNSWLAERRAGVPAIRTWPPPST
jgi:hypothetical protein